MSKVNVIVPVYNAENDVEKCVESVIFGEYQDIEVILVDDYSTDNSWDKCQELASKYDKVRCYQNEQNSGVSATRNFGLDKADSEYIMFVDSDDWVSCKYAQKLMTIVENYPEVMPACGFKMLNYITGKDTFYLFDNEKKQELYTVTNFFDLQGKIHMQQLWNKVFRRDIIEKHNIRFDINQSMGEDFQFVLDYLKASQIKKAIVINEPLYYYIRANSSSLMSKFGLVETENEEKRAKLLFEISENTEENKKRYEQSLVSMKNNHIYQIARNNTIDQSKKLELIERIMNDGNAQQHLNSQMPIIKKELLAVNLQKIKNLPTRIKNKLKYEKREKIVKNHKGDVTATDLTIISQNCIGGVFYHDMGLQFNSPTVNLFFKPKDFSKFVNNLEHYLSLDLKMQWDEEYPIGFLDDVEIRFMHFKSCTEAKTAWDRRKQRVNLDKVMVLSTDMEGFDDDDFEAWKQIKYPKLLFSSKDRQDESVLYYPKYKDTGLPNIIDNREFYQNDRIIDLANSI